MDLTPEEKLLITSALRNDRVGNWGDGRKEKIEKLLKKIGKGDN